MIGMVAGEDDCGPKTRAQICSQGLLKARSFLQAALKQIGHLFHTRQAEEDLAKVTTLREAQTFVVTGFENFRIYFATVGLKCCFSVRSFNPVSSVHPVKIEFCRRR